jgi:phosphoribosylglycinamide formyltransferase 2
VIIAKGNSTALRFGGLEQALSVPYTQIRLFGKPEVAGERRVGVALALGETVAQARDMGKASADSVDIVL